MLELAEIEEPVPQPDEVRVKVHATAVTSSDCLVRGFRLPRSKWIQARLALGLTKPRQPVLGMVLAGEIDAVGSAVTDFQVGDRVYGLDRERFGAYAAYKCMPQDGILAPEPASLDHVRAAAIPYGGLLAMHLLRKGGIAFHHKVLVYGASGAVGTATVQLAKHFGAEVTGVCGPKHLGLVEALGADTVIDYTAGDFLPRGVQYDIIIIAVGDRVGPPSPARCRAALAPHGAYVAIDHGTPQFHAADLILLGQLTAEAQLRPIIDRRYTLDQIVEAHRYVDLGHEAGTVVLTVTDTAD
ncbi:NAD(P)-dependent alcohol dehydrogenase [Nocardia terrae]|uniref:NAD(P)-dependent alcohol dehydrogenase n=1 Tax=Nocardia terrae TaxID=2675851 RepID=UPI002E264E9D